MKNVSQARWCLILLLHATHIEHVTPFQPRHIREGCCQSSRLAQTVEKILLRKQVGGRNDPVTASAWSGQSVMVLSATNMASPSPSSLPNDGVPDADSDDADIQIEGLVGNFETLNRIDATIQELRRQLPRLLTQPLTTQSAAKVYDKDCQLVVIVKSMKPDNDASSAVSNTNNQKQQRQLQEEEINTGEKSSEDTESSREGSNSAVRTTDKEIILTQSREELISLSDVIVLGNTATRQANNVWNTALGTSTSNSALPSTLVDCQLLLDPTTFSSNSEAIIIRVPWKTTVPVLPLRPSSPSSSSDKKKNQLEGFSELIINVESGKIVKHCVVQVMFDGAPMNGPAIGQALTTWQTAVKSIQQSPLVQTLLSPTTTSLLTGFLGQAAATAGFRSEIEEQEDTSSIAIPPVFLVPKEEIVDSETKGAPWINISQVLSDESQVKNTTATTLNGGVPLPGTPDWKQYALSHQYLKTFCDTVIPILSTGSTMADVARLFSSKVTLTSDVTEGASTGSGTLLLKGREDVASYFTNLALARRGGGGSWTLKQAKVHWKECAATIDYEATLRVGIAPATMQWTVRGRDIYFLQKPPARDDRDDIQSSDLGDYDDPIIERIHQVKFSVSPQDGSVTIDNHWLMRNLARTVEQGNRLGSGVISRDILSDLLLRQIDGDIGKNQPIMAKNGNTPKSGSKRRRRRRLLPESAAANIYHFMSHMHDEVDLLLNTTIGDDDKDAGSTPPGLLYMEDSVELRGYLGETLIRGLAQYKLAIGAFFSSLRQGIDQKLLIVAKYPPDRVIELTSSNLDTAPTVRLTLTLKFRLSSPLLTGGSTILLPEALADVASSVTTVPLKLEIISDYVIDPQTGMVEQHRLVESRVNDQLTPGDVLSRNIQRFLKLSSESGRDDDKDQDLVLKLLSDGFSWLRSRGT